MKGLLTRSAYTRLWCAWTLAVALIFFLCMCIGPGEIGDSTTHSFFSRLIHVSLPHADLWSLRLFRVLPAAMVGFALAAAGVALQALLRNPLADPYVLGISSGSSVGVMVWLLIVGPFYTTVAASDTFRLLLKQGAVIPAVGGALLTCLLVFILARSRSGAPLESLTLLLVGIVVSAVNAALLMLLNHFAPPDVSLNLQNYMMGSISNDITTSLLIISGAIIFIAYLPMLFSASALNIASLSELEAVSMGVPISRLRTLCFISASILTAASIMLAGPIGFVGLICPHICRRLVGGDHRKLIVAAPLCGAAFLMLADTFVSATGYVFRGELPVGIITALCGGPFFLLLLKRRTATEAFA